MMPSPKKTVPFVAILVMFAMLLCSRGLGLQTIMDPKDTRIIFLLQMLLGLTAIIVFLSYKDNYSTEPIAGDSQSVCQFFLSNETPARTVSDFLAQHASVLAVYIFGAGSVALNFGYIYVNSQCMEFFKDGYVNVTNSSLLPDDMSYSNAVVKLVGTLVKTCIIIIEIPLLHYLTMVTHRRRRSVIANTCILIIMGANLSIWLITFLGETHLLEVLPFHGGEAYTADLRNACLTHSDVVHVWLHESLEKVLFPFSMEFCITSMEILYHVYFVTVIVDNPAGQKLPEYKRTLHQVQEVCTRGLSLEPYPLEQLPGDNDTNEMYEVLEEEFGDNDALVPAQAVQAYARRSVLHSQDDQNTMKVEIVLPGDEPRQPSKSVFAEIRSTVTSVNTPTTALIFGILEALLIKFFLIHEELVKEGSSYVSADYIHYYCNVPLIVFCIVVDGIPLLTVTCHCVCVIREFPHKRKHPPAYKNSILLALLGITVLTSFKIIVSAIKLHKQTGEYSERVLQLLTLLECSVFLPQYFLQSLLIYVGQRRLSDPSNAQYATLRGALSYITMNNFVHWGISSFLETEYLTNRMELHKDVQLWDTLVLLFTPTFIFFYFLSTFLLLQVKTLLADSGKPWQRWSLRLKIQQKQE